MSACRAGEQSAAEQKAMNQHIVRTLGYTGIFVVFVAAAGYFIFAQPNYEQQIVVRSP